MDGNRHPNGHPAHSSAHPYQARNTGSRMRIPTVNEALPFSPFSSIVPFNPEVIPPPLALPIGSSSRIDVSTDHQTTRRMLDQLSAGATSAENASKRYQHTLRDLRKLLDPESLTQFKFKTPNLSRSDHSNSASKLKRPALSPFAEMVFESTNVSFRYLTPESPEPTLQPTANGVQHPSQEGLPTPDTRANLESTKPNGYHTPQQTQKSPSKPSTQVKAVVVPSTLTPAQRAEFQYVSEGDNITVAGARDPSLSMKRESRFPNGARAISLDQRQRGDAAVDAVQSLLQEIFEAEDQLQLDTSGAVTVQATAVFAVRGSDEGRMPSLHPAMQEKLDSYMQKVITLNRFDDIPVDSLARTQKLCEGAVSGVSAVSLLIGDDWSEQDITDWLHKLAIVENGLLASRTLLRIMTAGRQEKELQSEDFLRCILEALRSVVEYCVVPIVEETATIGDKIRGGGKPHPNPKFLLATANRKPLQQTLNALTRVLRLLGSFLAKTDIDETSISSVEYLCKTLVFAENASTERESAIGIQNFENTRKCAMDVLAKIFTKYIEQRQFIFDEILISLEKLPATKQSARQFRLPDTKPIQLVSALLMRLVQTSATRSGTAMHLRSKGNVIKNEDDESDVEESESEESSEEEEDEDEFKVSPCKRAAGQEDLASIARPLQEAAQANASYIIKILVQRALSTSKSSDEPYRKLLDIFTEDFLGVLGSSDWPSAELLLLTLASHMIAITDNSKSPAPSRTLALELLATMGSGILELQMNTRKAAASLDAEGGELSVRLLEMTEQLAGSGVSPSSLINFDGPYRVVIEFLQARGTDDAQLQTARGFYLMQWAANFWSNREGSAESDSSDGPRASKDLQSKLRDMITDPHWLEEHYSFPTVSTAQGRLAAKLITLSSRFCKAFKRMLNTLFASLSNEHPTIKSRGLKSVAILLEKDPCELDRTPSTITHIFRCADDASPLVRDSALNLIAKCMALRPALDVTVYERVIARTHDAATGVRKRAMKLLKDIYLRNDSAKLRSSIANTIIARINDTEESVTELARLTVEEIWFAPLQSTRLSGDGAVEAKLLYRSQAALIIRTVGLSDNVLNVLESLLTELLTKSKAASANKQVCKKLVSMLFDGVIDAHDIPGSPSQSSILLTLTVFAKASPQLFTAAQLERLEPYTQNLANEDDLQVFRSVLTILRHTISRMSMLKPTFLHEMHRSLMASVTKLPKGEIADVAPCLWAITGMLKNTEKLVNFVSSALSGIRSMAGTDLAADPTKGRKLTRLMNIVGQFCKVCDFEEHLAAFQSRFSWFKGSSVSGLAVELLCAFSSPKQPLSVREASVEATCAVCQGWPNQFVRSDVINAFETVFKDRIPTLEGALLAGLEGFFCGEETPKEGEAPPALGAGVDSGTERLGRTYIASDHDGAAASLTQRFLPQIVRLALASCDEPAFIAAKLIASVNRQGLSHPKESGPSLVALETCPNTEIASLAFAEHRALHGKSESMLEKEYMRAVQQAFTYQQQVVGSSAGFTGQPPVSKLHLFWEVLKTGKAQGRKKFLTNICLKLDFDPARLEIGVASPHLDFVRFCTENLAFFEYDRIDELLHLNAALEKAFAGTGTAVAQLIESEVLQITIAEPASSQVTPSGASQTLVTDPASSSIDNNRLRQLAVSAQILYLIWEIRTFLRRLWMLQKHASKTKGPAKETSKAPTRATNAVSLTDAYLKRINEILSATSNVDAQRALCEAFVDLISVDTEVKVGSEQDEDVDVAYDYGTPSEGTSDKSVSVPPSGGGRGRKRKSLSVAGPPRKKGRPSIGGRRKSGSARRMDEDDKGDWE